ncbi:MAG TPA: hypothetical protein VLB27_06090, partial [candidate division Zixibacteria bacterium]|nr:hypothetical protein [candidate division Zixibacteria bacterium]
MAAVCAAAIAMTPVAGSAAGDQPINVSDYIKPNGTIDLEAIRADGFEGNLTLDGFQAAIDPNTLEPVFHPRVSMMDPEDVYWSNEFFLSGFDGAVRALIVFNGDLIAGGEFTEVDSITASGIARWDGTEWHSLTSGVNGIVYALEIYNSDLIVGGTFSTAGGVAAANIASWDGSNWSALSLGVDQQGVRALTVYNTDLIVGGLFRNAGGSPADRIASWDGASWSPLGLGTDDGVWSLTVYNSELIAGGRFVTVDGDTLNPVNYIARWNGSAWNSLGVGVG